MKKLLSLLAIITMLSVNTIAQNLVPNPSFEVYDTCPDYANQVYHCVGWENWLTTPDYFNTCAMQGTSVSVPYNCGQNNFQYAHTGNAYVGLFNFWTEGSLGGYPWGREEIAIQLAQPMQVGVKYYLTMYISLASWIPSPCASSKFGVKFTTQSYSIYGNTFSSPLVNNNASIYVDSLLYDTLNWTKITGSFIADSSYEYLVIGNFFDDLHTDTLIIGAANFCYSYYLVDDVCLSTDSLTCSPVGLNVLNLKNEIKLFPNPMNDESILELPDGKAIQLLKLNDVMGNVIPVDYSLNSPSRVIIRKGNLAKGVYCLSVFYKQYTVTVKLIIY